MSDSRLPTKNVEALTRRRFLCGTALASAGLAMGGAGTFVPAMPPSVALNPGRRLSSFYVPMRDGTRIAVDLWLPRGVNRRVGTILQPTRYTRNYSREGPRPLEKESNFALAELINNAGMAYVIADGRGTGASFGRRGGELTATEFDDFGQLVDWLAAQPFSNGRVGAMGVSYAGTLTENLAKTSRPALKAIAPLFNYFDVYRDLAMPGGVYSRTFMDRWEELVGTADRVPEYVCRAAKKKGEECDKFAGELPLPKPVDGAEGMIMLRRAMTEHAANVSFAGIVDRNKLHFSEDHLGEFSWKTMSPAGDSAALEASNVAYFVQASWLDAGSASGALRRFAALSNEQQVEIGAWSHGGGEICDTLLGTVGTERSVADRFGPAIAFFAGQLGAPPASRSRRNRLRYYVMGEGSWRETTSWPPPGVRMTRHFLDGRANLLPKPPIRPAKVPIAIKAHHGTGVTGRWGARPAPIAFDRTGQTAGLTSFRTAPLDDPLILAGHVRCSFEMTSDQRDGSIFAYLDAVSPSGDVRYLTEGALRLIHRAVRGSMVANMPLSRRRFTRADARPVKPNKPFRLVFELLPFAARITPGWRLQLSLADRDVNWFDRYDEGAAPSLSIVAEPNDGSWIDLPILKL